MFGKIGEFIKPFFVKSDNLPTHAPGAVGKVGSDERQPSGQQGQGYKKKAGQESSAASDDFAEDRTVLSLSAVRAALMEGAGSISEEDIRSLVTMLDRLAKRGVKGIPVAGGEQITDAVRHAARILEEERGV